MATAKTKFLFTPAAINKLQPKATQYDCFDAVPTLPGFGVRVTANGTKSWQLVLRVFDPVKRKWTPTRRIIGRVGAMDLKDARELAHEILKDARAAKDVRKLTQRRADEGKAVDEHRAIEEAKANSFGAARAEYLARCAKVNRPATVSNYTDHLNRFDDLADKPLMHATRDDFYGVIDDLLAEGKNTMARRVHETLRRFFKWAKKTKRFTGDVDEIIDRERPGHKEPRGKRYLTDAEIAIVWRACEALPVMPRALSQVLMLLGQRSAETAGMRWSELHLDGDNPTWSVPPSRAKTGNVIPEAHTLPLPQYVVNILKGVPRRRGNEHVFWEGTGGHLHADQGNSRRQIQKRCREIVKAERIKGVFAEKWTTHDLRRTLATGMARIGINKDVASMIIHHRPSEQTVVDQAYQHYRFETEARAALERWCAHVIDLGEGRKVEKVVPLKRA